MIVCGECGAHLSPHSPSQFTVRAYCSYTRDTAQYSASTRVIVSRSDGVFVCFALGVGLIPDPGPYRVKPFVMEGHDSILSQYEI